MESGGQPYFQVAVYGCRDMTIEARGERKSQKTGANQNKFRDPIISDPQKAKKLLNPARIERTTLWNRCGAYRPLRLESHALPLRQGFWYG